MAMPCSMVVHIRVAAWVHWYLLAVAIFADAMDLEPDMEKVTKVAIHGVRAVVVDRVAVQA